MLYLFHNIILLFIQTATKISFMYSQKRNCVASVPIFTFMCLWAIYQIRVYSQDRSYVFLQQKRQTVRRNILYKSLTDTWMWKLGLRLRNSSSRNVCFEFSVLCFCSAVSPQCLYEEPVWGLIMLCLLYSRPSNTVSLIGVRTTAFIKTWIINKLVQCTRYFFSDEYVWISSLYVFFTSISIYTWYSKHCQRSSYLLYHAAKEFVSLILRV